MKGEGRKGREGDIIGEESLRNRKSEGTNGRRPRRDRRRRARAAVIKGSKQNGHLGRPADDKLRERGGFTVRDFTHTTATR